MPKDPIFRNEEKKVIILNLFSIFDLVAWFNKNWRNSDKIRIAKSSKSFSQSFLRLKYLLIFWKNIMTQKIKIDKIKLHNL